MRHSAIVDLRLEVDGESLDVAQTGDRSFILRTAREFSPGELATLVVVVDGTRSVYSVTIDRVEGCVVWYSRV